MHRPVVPWHILLLASVAGALVVTAISLGIARRDQGSRSGRPPADFTGVWVEWYDKEHKKSALDKPITLPENWTRS